MLDQRRVAAQPDENRDQAYREQLFTERYEALRVWALQLTNHQTDVADDLVQDAYVQWVLGRTKLEEIENIDGYLRTMLRNMHFAKINRSAQRLHETALSIADYDSCQLGWTAIEPPRRMQAAEELHQICAYACLRKESSKAASVLILRFFHNYFPTEIAGVLNSSRNSVDQWQRLARREAKLFLNRPGGLRFVNGHAPAQRHPVRYLKSDCDLMLDLRELIFSSRHGDCVSTQELEVTYASSKSEPLTSARLAHIVSCPACLDAVNVFLGLPSLAERYRAEADQRKQPPTDVTGGGASGGGSVELPKKFAHRLRETREHKPQELRIAVNGVHVSSIKINSELSELDLKLTPDDPIDFVEIFSEQGIQLLFFSIESDRPVVEQWASIDLSEGRSVEASYQDNGGPSLRVVYKDPTLDEAYVTGETPDTNALSSPLTVVPAVNVAPEPIVGTHRATLDLRAWVKRLMATLRNGAGEETTPDEDREVPILRSLGESRSRENSRWRLAVIVLACVAVVAAFLYFKASLSRELNAKTLLEQAAVAEHANQTAPEQVSHRIINLEERRSAEGAIVARRKIEIWQHGANGMSARRLYDDANSLIGGVWQKSDGSRAVFHHGAKPRSEPALATPDDLLLNLDDIWQLEPSAQSFSALIGATAAAEAEARSTTYVLSYRKERTIGASRLLKATLTLSKSDLHAIEQTLLVQRGGDLHEYRFAEASFEMLPQDAVAPAVFDIEPGLIGGAAEPGRPGDWALRDLTSSRVPPSPSTSTPPAASAELEVDVAYLLNRAKADRNEQVTLTRSVGGSLRAEGLRVEGVVDNQQRKEEYLRALAPVRNNPAVTIDIRTVDQAARRPPRVGSISVLEAEETVDKVATDDDLRAYFEKRNPSGPTDEAVRSYSSRVVNRAYRALFHAIELKKLVSRFANVDMRTVAPDARAKWIAMLREHAAAMERETAALRQELQPVFFPSVPWPASESFSIDSDADLARAVERLHKLALSNNDAVRSAFTTSSQSSSVAVKSLAFWHAMWRVEELAARIEGYDH